MASENNLNAVFTDIANAIRDKKGSVDTIKPINMADEINSIQVGDTNFKDLVEGTITSVDDDTITNVKAFKFYNCTSLTSVNLPNVISINNSAFEACTSLVSIDLSSATSVGTNVFSYCLLLTTLILRANQVCALSNISAFGDTPIATSTTEGFIYVPDDLVESYKTATNWSTYASKIKGLSELPTE